MTGAPRSCSCHRSCAAFHKCSRSRLASISALAAYRPSRLKYASGLFNMMRNLGGAVGIAVCGAVLNNRTNFHFHAIASNLTPANGAMTRLVNEVAQRYRVDPREPASGIPGSAQTAVATHLPRGVDPRLRRRLSRHHGVLRLCDDAGPFLRNVTAPKVPVQAAH